MKSRKIFIQSLIIGVLCFLPVVGCASFSGKELPKYTYEQIIPHNPKPSIDYDDRFLSFGKDNVDAVKIFQKIDYVFG